MLTAEMKENIKRHYGDTDEDLKDLAEIMDALEDVEKVDELKTALETAKLEMDKALKDLDTEWRTRYRERFFDGDVGTPLIDPEGEDDKPEPEEITIEDYIEEMKKEN